MRCHLSGTFSGGENESILIGMDPALGLGLLGVRRLGLN